MAKKSSLSKSVISVQAIVLAATAWAVIALLFFLLFSIPSSDGERPLWYSIATYVLEEVAFLGAGVLCFRNWRSSQIVSGRTVWLAIGLGMFSYFIGNLLLAYWEIGLGNSPDVSPGDLFFILTYLFLVWGMLLAVISRQLSLTPLQWGILVIIAIAGIALATVFAPLSGHESASDTASPAAVQSIQASPAEPAAGKTAPAVAPSASPGEAASPTPAESEKQAPAWAVAVEATLAPFAAVVSWLYIILDVMLVVMATTLLLAFWGGRFSLSWRFIAAAAISYYISDIWFNYATNYIPNYQTGALPEVFWIFSGCLFAIGAALEYDLSTRSRRAGRRRA